MAGATLPPFHSSKDSVTLATPLPAFSSARTGLRQYSPHSSASRTLATIGLPPSFVGYSMTAVGQAPFGYARTLSSGERPGPEALRAHDGGHVDLAATPQRLLHVEQVQRQRPAEVDDRRVLGAGGEGEFAAGVHPADCTLPSMRTLSVRSSWPGE